MSNTTEEYIDVSPDGGITYTSLHTLAWNLEKFIDSVPARRGGNFIVPYRHGELWRPKFFTSKAIGLAMWINDADQDGLIAATETARRAQLRQNVETLKALFGTIDRELLLRRRIRLQSGLVTRTATAEVLNIMEFEPNDDFWEIVALGVELHMADPFWYGTTATQTTVPFAGATVTNAGTARAQKMTIRLNGPLTNPRLENQSPNRPVQVTYTGTIASGDWVELDTDAFTAYHENGSNVIGNVSHSGGKFWMELVPGGNTLIFGQGSSGSGNAVLTFYPPYL